MIVIKPAKSYQLMEAVFQRQNAGKPLAGRLKGAHLELVKAILRLWQMEVGKYQRCGFAANPNGAPALRTLRTNTKQLAKMTHRAERTVRNLLNRLEAFGWLKKTFHGSNASFELALNTDLLYLQDTDAENTFNVADWFVNPLTPLRQFLPHTLSRVTRQDTNKLNELSGLASDDEPATASAAPPSTATQQQRDTGSGYHPSSAAPASSQQDSGSGYHPGSTASDNVQRGTGSGYHPNSEAPASRQQDSGTGYHPGSEAPAGIQRGTPPPEKSSAKKDPPARRPETLAEVVQHLDQDGREQVARLVDTVLEHALEELDQFFPGYLVPAERERGRACLAEYFVYGNRRVWKEAALQFIERVDLTGGWLERRYSAGKKAFLPLPSIWFDHRNEKGFAVTKAWYKTQQHQLKKMKIEATINRCLKDYWRAHQKNVAITPEEALRTIRQYLEKRGGPVLFALFQQKIKTAGSTSAAA